MPPRLVYVSLILISQASVVGFAAGGNDRCELGLENAIPTSDLSTNPFSVAQIFLSAESFFQDTISCSSFNLALVKLIHQSLSIAGVPEQQFPTPVAVGRAVIVIVSTLIGYYLLLGKNHMKKRVQLAQELQIAEAKVRYLKEKLLMLQPPYEQEEKNNKKSNKEIRIFMDGAFDLLHYGHMNAFRLARSLGTHLVVGVNSDESILECKGAPLMNNQERITMVQACKFVDEVVPDCPYIMNHEYLSYVFHKYDIDYVVHGDDPCIVDGVDVYASSKESGRFRSIPRTEGVSTTDIVGRMLLMTKDHHYHNNENKNSKAGGSPTLELLGQQSKFLTTSLLLKLFSADVKAPKKGMRIIYIDGAWDLFHPGHVQILKAARERGDYLIVGIYGDALVNKVQGMNLPLMNLHERVLSVLGCRFADDVLIDAPYEITKEMIASLKISEVVSGTKGGFAYEKKQNRYRYAKEAGIFTTIDSPSGFNILHIVERIQRNQETIKAKFERKIAAEKAYYDEKHSKHTLDAAANAAATTTAIGIVTSTNSTVDDEKLVVS